ncbi:MAG: uroporphyrinogen-III synthase [Wolbachia endosymbiont of Tyrophagus putrescentiae]|nr:uroporphyrinogen-III synthase [Wolbachia endosymbiont of Tyrophagus putrescentiae]
MKSVLLTRPLLDSLGTRSLLKRHGYKVYIEPVFTVKYLYPDLSLYEFDVVVSTSKNSIKAFSHVCKINNLPIITVGNATMETAKNLGFVNVESVDSNVEDLILFIKSYYAHEVRFLYIRGQEVSYDLKKKLFDDGFDIKEVILYRTITKRHLSNRCKNLLLDGAINGVVFFSSQTARVFCSLILKCGLSHLTGNIVAYAISKNVADNLKQVKWKAIIISRLPTQENLIDTINKDSEC